ncbi:MAG: YceI family protein [Acidimicrobiia bacterium]|nr:YceI family protein [Acidimicrobiia bacterium]
MKKWIGFLAGGAALVVVASVGYVWFSGGSGEPSTNITAPPITTLPTTSAPSTSPDTSISESVATSSGPVATDAAPAQPEPTEPTTVASTSPPSSSGGTEATIYRIDQSESSVRFEIDEILNGAPFRVVGTTSEVAGEMLIDFENPSRSRLGTVVINVRTLSTDSSFRDRAMRGPILGSARDEYEFAQFEPTDIEGLPDQVNPGEEIPLTITGNFTLSGVSNTLTFNAKVKVVSDDRVEVTGTATVLRSDYGLNIPNVPSVTDVADEILLAVDLVAVPG